MKKQYEEICEHCGNLVREYPHKLNKNLVKALMTFAKRLKDTNGGDFSLDSIGLSHSQQANWQKLQYFGLIERDGDNDRVNKWSITPTGYAFLRGDIAVLDRVNTFNKAIRPNSQAQMKYCKQIVEIGYWNREDYLNTENL